MACEPCKPNDCDGVSNTDTNFAEDTCSGFILEKETQNKLKCETMYMYAGGARLRAKNTAEKFFLS